MVIRTSTQAMTASRTIRAPLPYYLCTCNEPTKYTKRTRHAPTTLPPRAEHSLGDKICRRTTSPQLAAPTHYTYYARYTPLPLSRRNTTHHSPLTTHYSPPLQVVHSTAPGATEEVAKVKVAADFLGLAIADLHLSVGMSAFSGTWYSLVWRLSWIWLDLVGLVESIGVLSDLLGSGGI